MSNPSLLVPQYVLDDWLSALEQREPRALELAYGLAMALPKSDATTALYEIAVGASEDATARDVAAAALVDGAVETRTAEEMTPREISNEVRGLLDYAYEKYAALTHGDFMTVDMGNPNVLAFERRNAEERLLIVNNLARVSQPVKFKEYAAKEGWDILNRVEFTFPARAQLEAYEFLWLLLDG